jgi:muconolactone delta-isomerase
MDYLVTMTTHVPDGVTDAEVDVVRAAEHTRSLVRDGPVLRLWRPPLQPGEWRTLGLFAAEDEDALGGLLASRPLRVWRTDEVTPLRRHPNDPGPDHVVLDPARTAFLTTVVVHVPTDADP